MGVVTMKQLLEAGVHFGHQAKRWNPKMRRFIFTERNGIHIIDLHKTLKKVEESYNLIRDKVKDGGTVLFVGTKKQAQDSIKNEALRAGQFYINNRWLGGMLTNFKTISSRIDRLKELEKMEEDGTLGLLPKKEASNLRRELEKLNKNLGGIKEMKSLPDVIFIVDTLKEELAIKEAKKLGIPIVAMIDTNCDPDQVDYVIPSNDDAIRSVTLMAKIVANAVVEAKEGESAVADLSVKKDANRKIRKVRIERNDSNTSSTTNNSGPSA